MTKATQGRHAPPRPGLGPDPGPGLGAERRKPTYRQEMVARLPRPESGIGDSDAAVGKALVEAIRGGGPSEPGSRARTPAEAPGATDDRPPRTTSMHVSKTLWPPQPGTVRLLREHGDALVCVRYRHDTSGLYRYTTVELIVDHAFIGGSRFGHRLFEVAIGHGDREMRTMLMAEGSTWDPERQTWCVSGTTVRRLKLWLQVLRPLSK